MHYAPHTKLETLPAAEYVGSAKKTLEKLRCLGGGPAYIKHGRKVVYQVSDLDAWVDRHRRTSTSGEMGVGAAA